MTRKLNCWEFKNCGREKDGLMVDILGECPVATAMHCDGLNGGVAGGRVCWTLKQTSDRANRICTATGGTCSSCEFYRRVVHEEESQVAYQFSSAACRPRPLSADPDPPAETKPTVPLIAQTVNPGLD